MAVDIPRISFEFCAAVSPQYAFPRSHARELVVAALGYQSLIAYRQSAEEAPALDDAMHLVIDEKLFNARAIAMGHGADAPALLMALRAAFLKLLPGVKLYVSESALFNAIQRFVDDRCLNAASGQLAETNSDGLDEIYLPMDFELAKLEPPGEETGIDIDGHISVHPDEERPYSGEKVKVSATLTVRKISRAGIGEFDIEVHSAELDWSWANDDDHEDCPPIKYQTNGAKFAEELGLEEEDVDALDQAVITENVTSDGMQLGWIVDFDRIDSEETLKRIQERLHGQRVLYVLPSFFDDVAPDL